MKRTSIRGIFIAILLSANGAFCDGFNFNSAKDKYDNGTRLDINESEILGDWQLIGYVDNYQSERNYDEVNGVVWRKEYTVPTFRFLNPMRSRWNVNRGWADEAQYDLNIYGGTPMDGQWYASVFAKDLINVTFRLGNFYTASTPLMVDGFPNAYRIRQTFVQEASCVLIAHNRLLCSLQGNLFTSDHLGADKRDLVSKTFKKKPHDQENEKSIEMFILLKRQAPVSESKY